MAQERNSFGGGVPLAIVPPEHAFEGMKMPKRKSQTAAEQNERFRREEQNRAAAGLPSIAEADEAVDAMIRKNIKDYGA